METVAIGGMLGTLFFIGLSLGLYFLPGIIAGGRHHHNALAIFMLNLLLGWTLLGWVGAMVWACTAPTTKAQA